MSKTSAHLRIAVAMGGFALALLVGGAFALAGRDRRTVRTVCARWIRRLALPPLGLRLSVSGADRLVEHRPCVVVVNHQSIMEVPVLAGLFPHDGVLVARAGVGRLPLVGRLLRATGNILVQRGERGALANLLAKGRVVAARGEAIWMFPEGTRNAAPDTLLPFKRGAFALAETLSIPVIPVVVSPLWPAVEGGCDRRVRVEVLAPVRAGPDGVETLAAAVREAMQARLRSSCRVNLPSQPTP